MPNDSETGRARSRFNQRALLRAAGAAIGTLGRWKRPVWLVGLIALVAVSAVTVITKQGPGDAVQHAAPVRTLQMQPVEPPPAQGTCGDGTSVSGDVVGDANPAVVYATQCH